MTLVCTEVVALEHLHQEECLQGEGRQFLLEVWEVLVCDTCAPKTERTRISFTAILGHLCGGREHQQIVLT